MKVLIVSHSCVVKENQKKVEALAKNKDAEITLLIPYKWRESLRDIKAEKVHDKNYSIIVSNAYFNGRIGGHFYPLSLVVKLLRNRYDIIHIEEEIYSLVAFQFLFLNKFISRSKTTIFTWENIFIKYKFPKNLVEKFLLDNVNFIIVGNSHGKSVLEKKGYKGDLVVLPLMGVDPKHFNKNEDVGLKHQLMLSGVFVIGYVGRIVFEKGLLDLVDAVSGLSQSVKCLIIGRGILKAQMLERIKTMRLEERFHFINSVQHHEIPRYLNLMDCLVLPSLTVNNGWREQFGHVLIEAMSCGVPVIGSDSGSIPEVIGKAGLIFKERNSAELRDKILSLIQDGEKIRTFAERGRKKVLKNFSHEKIAERTIQIWKEI